MDIVEYNLTCNLCVSAGKPNDGTQVYQVPRQNTTTMLMIGTAAKILLQINTLWPWPIVMQTFRIFTIISLPCIESIGICWTLFECKNFETQMHSSATVWNKFAPQIGNKLPWQRRSKWTSDVHICTKRQATISPSLLVIRPLITSLEPLCGLRKPWEELMEGEEGKKDDVMRRPQRMRLEVDRGPPFSRGS